jgi:AhpD family alkylhydroperoxidase
MDENSSINNKEKSLVALAAAMGGGCRVCAENLYGIAVSVGATSDEIQRAFLDGLIVRQSATEIMREKAGALLGRPLGPDVPAGGGRAARVTELSRLAAAAAANSSPDALREIASAQAVGVTEGQIGLVIGIARAIRTKAQGFSDAEIGKISTVEVACGSARAEKTETDPPAAPATETDCCAETSEPTAEPCGCTEPAASPRNA